MDSNCLKIKLKIHDHKNNKNNDKMITKQDIILTFPISGINRGYRYSEFTAREYNYLFDKYFIPTTKNETFMILNEDIDNGIYMIPCWERAKNNISFEYNDYLYKYIKIDNIFNVQYMGNKEEIIQYPLPAFNGMFISYNRLYKDCKIKQFDMSKLSTDCCFDISEMFKNCVNLTDINNFVISFKNIHFMNSVFEGCVRLSKIDMSNCDSVSIYAENITKMFALCQSLTDVNISNLIISHSLDYNDSLFLGCKSLTNITCLSTQWVKIYRDIVPCHEYWIPQQKRKYKPLTEITITLKNDGSVTTYTNTYNSDITVVNVGDNTYKVLNYDY